MLSTENPPPDLCEISQLKSVSSDERTSGNNQHQFEVDLCNSGLDDSIPLPKFSIRDYVFSTRGKDIKNNWPFSQKNLQLCLNHGVKDVLPPFQSLDSVRNQSILECVDDSRDSDVKHSKLSDHSVREKLAVDIEKINWSESEGDKEFASFSKSQSCSDINSVPPSRSSCLELQAVSLPVSPVEKAVLAARGTNKADINNQSQVKRCRLIVKLNNFAEPKSNVDLASNTSVVSETMASKVCPVCKTFSSSSNTTLNAHIDQCLSGESSIKWTVNSKVIKHRIKPRKTRLMVDIYETAIKCTLEDLDKRNGTNWASSLGPPSQDMEASGEEEEKTYSSLNGMDINQEGGVYIDSSGRKLRILSKLSHLPVKPTTTNDAGPSYVKKDKGRKLLSSQKKKYCVQKHKFQKHSLDGQGSCSPISDHLPECPPHGPISEVDNRQQKVFHFDGYKEDDPMQSLATSDQMKSDDFGMIKKWVGSKRTGLKKKANLEHENRHQDKSMKNLRIKSVSSLGDAHSKGNIVSISPVSSNENPLFPTKSHKRKENLVVNSQAGCVGPSCQRKRPVFPSLKPHHVSDKKNHLVLSKLNDNQLRRDNPSVREHHTALPDSTENHVSSQCNKKMGISSSTNEEDYRSFIGSNMSQHHRVSSGGKKFASLRKTSLGHKTSSGSRKISSLRMKLLSIRHASVETKKNFERKHMKFKNTRLQCGSGSDEEQAVASRSAIYREKDMVEARERNETQLEKDSGKPFISSRVLKIRKKIGGVGSSREGDMTSKSLETSPKSDCRRVGKNVDSSTGGDTPLDTSDNVEEEAELRDEFVSVPTYGISGEEAFVSFNKSLDSAFPGLVLNADEGHGNYFVDVDPIPIPGPPGSFLPSPGRMGSEELQGHSSLTTCRMQSSEEEHEVVDMDSSDSPISAISAVSNYVAARSNSVPIPNLSEQLHFQHETYNISEDASGPVVEGPSPIESRPNFTSPEVALEAQNIQPCCCSRKDGSLQGGPLPLNYQDSQILRLLATTSQEKQMSSDHKNEINSLKTLSKHEPTREHEYHSANSPMAYAPLLVSRNSETIFPPCGDCDSPSPTPNPVLRLMGKNLMVVNNDENPSPQTRPILSSMMNETNSFHHNLSQGPSNFNNLQPGVPAQHFGFNSPSSFKIPGNCGPAPFSAYKSSTAVLPDTNFSGSVASRCHGYANGFNLIADQLGSKIRLDPQTTCDNEKTFTTIQYHLKPVDSSGKRKEIIGSPTGNAITLPPPKGMTVQLGKWNCIPEGSSVFSSNSSSASLPLTAHARSSVYFSPGFS